VVRTTALALLLVVGLSTGTALARSPRIIVFPAEGAVTGPLKKAPAVVTSAIVVAGRPRGARVEVAAGSMADAITLAGCEAKQPDCLGKVASTLDADLVVAISVGTADSGLFVDVDIGRRDAAEAMRANWILDGDNLAAIQKAAAREATILFSGDAPAPPAAPEPAPEPAAPATPAAPDLARDAEPAPAGRPAGEQASGLGRVRWYSWATAGAGVALMATGGVFLAGARGKQDDIDAASPSSLADFRELESLEDDAETQATWGSVMLGAGVVAAGVGAALILVQMRSSPDETGETVSLAPAAFDHGAGVSLTVLGDL
jgi:hypothetical protein